MLARINMSKQNLSDELVMLVLLHVYIMPSCTSISGEVCDL